MGVWGIVVIAEGYCSPAVCRMWRIVGMVCWNRYAMQELRQYKIFIASPSGLEAERDKLRQEVQFYSKYETEREGLTFSVVRYEDNAASFGNPQDGINPYLCECDFFVFVLHDRWGTPPGSESVYSSGSEHEFHLAYTCLQGDYPMREIALLHKPMDRNQRRRKEGRKVTDFIEKIKDSKGLYFQRFNNMDEFRFCIGRCLAKWRLELMGRMGLPSTPATVKDFFKESELREGGKSS